MNDLLSNKKDILISFNICCYNSVNYISHTIDSIISQTYKNWEIIVVNDGSSDDTEKIIYEYINKGHRIKYFFHQNKGFSYSRNIAINNSSGEWIALLDHDDLCINTRLAKQVKDIKNNKNCKLFFSNAEIFNSNNLKIDKFKLFEKHDKFNPSKIDLDRYKGYVNLIKYGCFITTSSVIINKKTAMDIGGFENKYSFISDYLFFINVAKKYNIYCNNEILVRWRKHDKQATSIKNILQIQELNSLYLSIYFEKLSIFIKYSILKKHIKSILKYFIISFLLLIKR